LSEIEVLGVGLAFPGNLRIYGSLSERNLGYPYFFCLWYPKLPTLTWRGFGLFLETEK